MCVTIVERLRCSPFYGDLFESRRRINAVILLTTHPKVTDLQHAVIPDKTVPRCQVPEIHTDTHTYTHAYTMVKLRKYLNFELTPSLMARTSLCKVLTGFITPP